MLNQSGGNPRGRDVFGLRCLPGNTVPSHDMHSTHSVYAVIKKLQGRAEVGKLRPRGHKWPGKLITLARRASQSFFKSQMKNVVSLIG